MFGREDEAYDVTAAMTNQLPAVLVSSGLFIRPAVRVATALGKRGTVAVTSIEGSLTGIVVSIYLKLDGSL